MSHRLFAAAALAAALAASPLLAQENEVLATVNGEPITAADVDFAYENLFGDALGQMPEEQAREQVLQLLVDQRLMAEAALEAGLSTTPEFARQMALTRLQILQQAYMAEVVEREVTEEAIRERYEALTAGFPVEEANASHILVETEEEAREIIAELEGGGDFATLAEERSMDPGTAQRGGDLGWFPRGRMVPEFEEAAFALEPGTITQEPVRSQFGWHVIRVDDRRTREAPEYGQVRERIREIVIRQVFAEEIDRLRGDAAVEMPGTGQ